MSELSHRSDVEFLEGRNPPLVERNADEFLRIRNMLAEADEPAERAEKKTHWQGEGSRHYEARVAEARKLVNELAEGYGKAASALRGYAFALTTAQAYGRGFDNDLSNAREAMR
ncbi:hypothetical protein ACFWM7_25125 [Streptomyces sp. NPDC058375]|uniref:hypothetical protein n=1 Tax=Streptomyces sp. NPDC058375 TaxID=3346467 RepID=UPI0036480282